MPGQPDGEVELARGSQRPSVLEQRLGPAGEGLIQRPVQRPVDDCVGGDVCQQVVTEQRDLARTVVEDGVGRGVARPVKDLEGPVAQLEASAVGDRAVDV